MLRAGQSYAVVLELEVPDRPGLLDENFMITMDLHSSTQSLASARVPVLVLHIHTRRVCCPGNHLFLLHVIAC